MEHSQKQIVSNQSMASAITSEIININTDFGFAVQAVYTTSGTLAGTLAIQASANHREDINGNVLFAGDFETITNSPVVITGAGNFIWNIRDPNYSFFQLIYTPDVSDTGTLNAYSTIKGI